MKNSNSRQVFIQTVFVIPIPCFPIIVLNVCATFTLSIYLLSNSPILNRCTRLCWLEIHKKSNGMCRKCTAQATWLIHTPNKQARFKKKYSKWFFCCYFILSLHRNQTFEGCHFRSSYSNILLQLESFFCTKSKIPSHVISSIISKNL